MHRQNLRPLLKIQGGDLKVGAIRIEATTGRVRGSTRFTVEHGAAGRCEFGMPMFVMNRP